MSPTSLKQKKPHPELKRTKSQGTTRAKIQKAQSFASMEEHANGGGAK